MFVLSVPQGSSGSLYYNKSSDVLIETLKHCHGGAWEYSLELLQEIKRQVWMLVPFWEQQQQQFGAFQLVDSKTQEDHTGIKQYNSYL